jgi:lysozyme family protein
MAEFLSAYRTVESNEGGYVFDKKDRGGETYFGITRRNFPTWQGWPIIDRAKPLGRGGIIDNPELAGMVKNFYKVNFWDKMQGDSFDSQAVAVFVYDWYVNSGKHALIALQRAVGVPVDGSVGTQTVEATNGYHETDLLAKLKSARIDFYHGIVAKDPTQSRFLPGWLNRVERLA